MYKVVVLGVAHASIFGMAAAAQQLRSANLVGVYDADPEQAAAAAQRLGVPTIGTVDEALAQEPAVVLIAAEPEKRVGLVEQAVAAGAAALVDNPPVVTHEALDRLIAAGKRHGKRILTHQPYRGEPLVRAAKAACDAGRVGQIVRMLTTGPHKLRADGRPGWHWTRRGNGGILIDVAAHGFDLACWFAGGPPRTVAAQHSNSSRPDKPEFQDFGQAQMRFDVGLLADVEADWLATDSLKVFGDTRIWIQGTRGKIELYFGDAVSSAIWTSEVAAEPLDTTPYCSADQWEAALIEALATGGDCDYAQCDVWQTSRVSLHAFDSAQAGGQPVSWQDPEA